MPVEDLTTLAGVGGGRLGGLFLGGDVRDHDRRRGRPRRSRQRPSSRRQRVRAASEGMIRRSIHRLGAAIDGARIDDHGGTSSRGRRATTARRARSTAPRGSSPLGCLDRLRGFDVGASCSRAASRAQGRRSWTGKAASTRGPWMDVPAESRASRRASWRSVAHAEVRRPAALVAPAGDSADRGISHRRRLHIHR